MVKETRHIFDLSDIKAIRLSCPSCEREAVQSVEKTDVPKHCPFCHADWEPGNLPRGQRGLTYSMICNLKDLVKQQSILVGVRFEIDGEEDK